jgi:hypothetical protein
MQHKYMKYTLTAILILFILACKKNTVRSKATGPDSLVMTPIKFDTSYETGGSNYAMYSVGNYLQYPTDSDWYVPNNLRPVIGTYDQEPDTVRKQLAVMYANGQRKIALDLWYTDFSLYGNPSDGLVNAHIVNSKLGRLMPQHESNLKSLLTDIENAGFNFVILRFATQGLSAPIGWNTWSQSMYNTNWSFVSSTINTVQQAISGKSIKVIYDLELEIGGVTNGQAVQYCTQMWKDYTQKYGSHNTIGFSFAYTYTQKINQAMMTYDPANVRPDIYGFDIYGDEFNALSEIKSELDAAGEGKKPIFMEEAFYNDAEANAQILNARQSLGMNIKWIMQWPLQRGATQNNFSIQYPADYFNYLH